MFRQFILSLIVLSCGQRPVTTTAFLPATEQVEVETHDVSATFYLDVMSACNAQLSAARKQMLATQITRIAHQYLPTQSGQEAFGFLICIESNFQDQARSTVGAVGLTQLMPKLAQEFAAGCGIGELNPKDLADAEVNLQVGACHFSQLIKFHNQNIALALASYNAGKNSKAVKQLGALVTPTNQETAGYVAKYGVLRSQFDALLIAGAE